MILRFAEEKLGALDALTLIYIIADIEALEDAGQLLAFLGKDALIRDDDSLLLPIGANYHAALVAAGKRFDRDKQGRVIWSSVTRLKLIKVVGN